MQNTENYELDPNFAVVCSFIERFGECLCNFWKELSIEGLKTFLEAPEVDKKDIFYKFHEILIRGVFGYCPAHACEKFIIKFCKDFPDGDDELIKKDGYGKVPVTVKLRILKNLCEDQFQYNDKFNRRVNDILEDGSTIRHEAVGKDKLGRSYWFMLDSSSELRLFRGWHNELTFDETWNVVCREIDDLEELIDLLEENENLTNEDKSFHVQPYQPTPNKISPSKQLPGVNDAAKALYFSSISSSPRFIKSPQHRRSKLEIRRDERKHKLPHCKVKLSRLKKCDIDKWKAKPYLTPSTDEKGKISLLSQESLVDPKHEKLVKADEKDKLSLQSHESSVDLKDEKLVKADEKDKLSLQSHESLVDLKDEKLVKTEKVTGQTTCLVEPTSGHIVKTESKKKDNDEVNVKTETECSVKSSGVSSLKNVVKEDKTDCIVKTEGKVNNIKPDSSESSTELGHIEKTEQKTELSKSEIKCALKTDNEATANVVRKSAQSGSNNSHNVTDTCSGESVTVSNVKTELSGVNTVSDAQTTEKSESSDVTENDKVSGKKTKRKEKSNNSDNVCDDLNKLPEKAVCLINEKGDASRKDKPLSGDNNVINSAANAQDLKETVSTDEQVQENVSDIFNAAIQELLTLESTVKGSSGVITDHKHDKGPGSKTAADDLEHTDLSKVNEKLKGTLESVEKVKDTLVGADKVKDTLVSAEKVKDTLESVKIVNDTSEIVDKVKCTSENDQEAYDTSESAEKEKNTFENDEVVKDTLERLEKVKDTLDGVEKVKDTSENDKKVLDKALKDLIQLEMMTKGSSVDNASATTQDKVLNKDPASKPIQEISQVSNTAAKEMETSVHSEKRSDETNISINQKNSTVETLKPIPPKKIVIVTRVNAEEKPNAVKAALSAKLAQSPHKSWSNLQSADSKNTQNVRNNLNIVIPSKSCNNPLDTGDFMNTVMSIIHDGGSVKNESAEMDKTKSSSSKTEKLEGDKVDADKDMNLLVGDEMVRIEVASNSSSDTESGEEEEAGETCNTSTVKSVSKTNFSTKTGLNTEKAAINSLYTNSKSVGTDTTEAKAGSALSPRRSSRTQTTDGVPKVLIPKAWNRPIQSLPKNVMGVSSSTPVSKTILIPVKAGKPIPNTLYLSQPPQSHTSNVVHVRPKPTLLSVLKGPPLTTPSSSAPVILAPFSSLPTGGNQICLLSGTPNSSAQLQTVLNPGVRPAVTSLPPGQKFVVTNIPMATARNPTSYKLPLLSQTLGTSQPLSFTMAAQHPTISNMIYVKNKPPSTDKPISKSDAKHATTFQSTGSLNENSTIKLALKKHLETPVGKVFVANHEREHRKTPTTNVATNVATMNVRSEHNFRDPVTNQPITYKSSKMSYVIAGPGGKYYDKETGYLMDIPECNKFTHIPGKVYLAADATFANGVKKPTQTAKKKSKKKKMEEPDTSDEEFEKLLESSESDKDEKSESSDDDYDYEKISKRVKTAKNLQLPSRRASVESVDESKLEEDEDLVPVVLGRNAKRAADRQLNYCEKKKVDSSDEETVDLFVGSCKVCGSSSQPSTILLCDDCDELYHLSCLSPPLSVVPLEDWFCPNCQHKMLVAALKEKLELAKKAYRKAHRGKRTISPTAFSIDSSNIMVVERRSRRERKDVSYNEEKYDKMVVDAVKEMNSDKKRKLSSGSSNGSSEDEDAELKDETKSNKKKSKSVRSTKSGNSKNSKPEKDVKTTRRRPSRAAHSETKHEDKDSSSSSKKHKRSRLSYTEPVSDDSGSEYIQSDHSSSSDQEESVPQVPVESPVKKTYLTLSGRATKNVSYKEKLV